MSASDAYEPTGMHPARMKPTGVAGFYTLDPRACGICGGRMSWLYTNWPLWRRYEGHWAHRRCVPEVTS